MACPTAPQIPATRSSITHAQGLMISSFGVRPAPRHGGRPVVCTLCEGGKQLACPISSPLAALHKRHAKPQAAEEIGPSLENGLPFCVRLSNILRFMTDHV